MKIVVKKVGDGLNVKIRRGIFERIFMIFNLKILFASKQKRVEKKL